MCTGTQSSPNIQDRVLYLLIMFVFKLSTEIYWVAEVHSRREEDSKIRRKPLKKRMRSLFSHDELVRDRRDGI